MPRHPDPPDLKAKKGTSTSHGDRRRPRPEPVGRPVPPPDMPADLSPLWHELVEPLMAARLVGATDAAAIAVAAASLRRFRDVDAALADLRTAPGGMFTAGSAGQLKPHPLVDEWHRTQERALAALATIGCTPAARAKLMPPAPPKQMSKFDGLLGGMDYVADLVPDHYPEPRPASTRQRKH